MATPQRTGQFHVPCHEHHVEMRLTDSVLQTIGLLSTAIFLWVGASQVIHGSLSVGGFVAFSSLTAVSRREA